MTQYPYPPPYQPGPLPYGGYPGSQDPRTPARRAGWMMLFLGLGMMLFGGGVVLISFALPTVQMPAETEQMMQQLESAAHMKRGPIFLVLGMLILVPGLLQAALSFLVRRGGAKSSIAGIVLTGLITLWLAINTLGTVARAGSMGPQVAPGICLGGGALALFITQLVMLISAVKAAPRVRAMRQQPFMQQSNPYAAQWQYQQQTGPYVPPQGYGYATQPVPPPNSPVSSSGEKNDNPEKR